MFLSNCYRKFLVYRHSLIMLCNDYKQRSYSAVADLSISKMTTHNYNLRDNTETRATRDTIETIVLSDDSDDNNDPEYNVNGISKTRTWHKNITLNHSGKCGRAYSFPNSENFPRENIDDPMFMNNETWWCPSSVDGYKDASHIEDHLKKTDPPIFYEGDVLLRKTIPPKGTNKHNPHVIINITKVA